MMNKLKRIYEIIFNLKKSVLCNTMLKTISFVQSCTFISMTQWDRKFKLHLESLD
jgi:hypothetical protein